MMISAAETSSDLHGAKLVDSLRELIPNLEVFGTVGPELRKLGAREVVPSEDLLVMGTSETFSRLSKIKECRDRLVQEARSQKPDVIVLIDYPEFHFSLAKRLKSLRIPIVYYIPPKIWVWRRNRLKKLEKYFDRILFILPFEKEVYRGADVPVTYVGNPILDELPLDLSQEHARQKLGLNQVNDRTFVAIFLGSRPSEVDHHRDLFIEAAVLAEQESDEKFELLFALPQTVDAKVEIPKIKGSIRGRMGFRVIVGDGATVLKAADFGLIKSGTSTLEAALMRLPHLIVYRPDFLTRFLFRHLVRYGGPVGLPNLVLEESAAPYSFPEIISDEATVDSISRGLLKLVESKKNSDYWEKRFDAVLSKLSTGVSPSLLAAQEVLRSARNSQVREDSALNSFGSTLWSSVNFARRRLLQASSESLDCKVIGIGNIQVGGSGKTPITLEIAREAKSRGMKVGVLTRGYRSQSEREGVVLAPQDPRRGALEIGDEAVLIREEAPWVWMGVGRNRVENAKRLIDRAGGLDLLILDDSFQNFQIKKDVEIALITSRNPRNTLFRDFQSELERSDLVLLTKGAPKIHSLSVPQVRVDFGFDRTMIGKKYFFASGIADPQMAQNQLQESGYTIVGDRKFEDHHEFNQGEVDQLLKEAQNRDAKLLITGKDWVKFRGFVSHEDLQTIEVVEPQVFFQDKDREIWNHVLWS